MAAILDWAYKFETTVKVIKVDTSVEQVQHIEAYHSHGYQHKSTHKLDAVDDRPEQWIMTFVKTTILLDSKNGDKVPL